MFNDKDLEEANKEVEKSKSILHSTEDLDNKEGKEDDKQEEGSGIFTTDGKELPKIDGGYDVVNPGYNLGENEIVSA